MTDKDKNKDKDARDFTPIRGIQDAGHLAQVSDGRSVWLQPTTQDKDNN